MVSTYDNWKLLGKYHPSDDESVRDGGGRVKYLIGHDWSDALKLRDYLHKHSGVKVIDERMANVTRVVIVDKKSEEELWKIVRILGGLVYNPEKMRF